MLSKGLRQYVTYKQVEANFAKQLKLLDIAENMLKSSRAEVKVASQSSYLKLVALMDVPTLLQQQARVGASVLAILLDLSFVPGSAAAPSSRPSPPIQPQPQGAVALLMDVEGRVNAQSCKDLCVDTITRLITLLEQTGNSGQALLEPLLKHWGENAWNMDDLAAAVFTKIVKLSIGTTGTPTLSGSIQKIFEVLLEGIATAAQVLTDTNGRASIRRLTLPVC